MRLSVEGSGIDLPSYGEFVRRGIIQTFLRPRPKVAYEADGLLVAKQLMRLLSRLGGLKA